MNKPRIKLIAIIITSFIAGVIFAYGFMWWQVYRKFDTVWTCQVFTGALSVEQSEMCAKYDPKNKPKYY